MIINADWYRIPDVEDIDSPALVFYPDRVKENIAQLLKMVPGKDNQIRPHIKTAKSKEPVLLMMEKGILKFKCATIAEAELLGQCGAPDVLLAYQPVLPKLSRLFKLIALYPKSKFSCLVDNVLSAQLFFAEAIKNGITLDVYIDLNVGMNRTGIAPGKNAFQLFETILNMKNLSLKGFHAYDGHIREKDLSKRTQICNEFFEPVEQMRTEIMNKGYSYPLLIAGGSPTFQIHANRSNTECSPGTFIFWDNGYTQNIPEQSFHIAALVLCRVISIPAENLICIDLGYKSISSENDLQNRVRFLNAPALIPVSHSEEHMVLKTPEGQHWKIGDILYASPVHICPTVAMYKEGICIENSRSSKRWSIVARDRSINV